MIIGNQLLGVMAMFARQPLSPIAIDALAMVSNNIALDIKRKQAENDPREIEEKFLRLFDRAPVPMTLARITDGAIVDVNEEFERVFGYTRQEALRKTAIELGINSDIGRRNREVAELVVRGSVRGIELDEAWS